MSKIVILEKNKFGEDKMEYIVDYNDDILDFILEKVNGEWIYNTGSLRLNRDEIVFIESVLRGLNS